MKKIHLRHENDRGTIPPYFWMVVIEDENGECTPVDPGPVRATPISPWTTKERAEDMVVEIGEKAGVKDTTDADQWAKAGLEVIIHKPAAGFFKNWPE